VTSSMCVGSFVRVRDGIWSAAQDAALIFVKAY